MVNTMMTAESVMKIMIVEDEEDSRIMLTNLLKGHGHTVFSVLNGKKALELLSESVPDLIITDILMPEIDGFDLCRRIKNNAEWAHIPIIFYTATYTSRADEELGILMGASKFIIKPQEPEILLELINNVIYESKTNKHQQTQILESDSKYINQMQLEVVKEKLQKKVDVLENVKVEKKSLDDKLGHLASEYHKIVELLSDFEYCASHDLIEPLRKISSFSSRLKEAYENKSGEQQQICFDVIERSSLRMKRYIDDLAHFAMIAKAEINYENIPLEEIFKEVLEAFSSEIKNNDTKIIIECPHTIISGWPQLKEVFKNIVSNSLNSKKENTPLEIHITSEKTKDGFLDIHIEDSGVGFDEKYTDKIFKPFQTLNPNLKENKSGMGLAFSKLIIDRLEGKITTKSSPNQGATFTIRLPLKPVT